MKITSAIDSNEKYNIYNYKYKTITTSIPFDSCLATKLKQNDKDYNTVINNFIQESDALALYTDGSKVSGANYVGCSVYCPELQINEQISVDKHASVYTAEYIALHKAFKIATEL